MSWCHYHSPHVRWLSQCQIISQVCQICQMVRSQCGLGKWGKMLNFIALNWKEKYLLLNKALLYYIELHSTTALHCTGLNWILWRVFDLSLFSQILSNPFLVTLCSPGIWLQLRVVHCTAIPPAEIQRIASLRLLGSSHQDMSQSLNTPTISQISYN